MVVVDISIGGARGAFPAYLCKCCRREDVDVNVIRARKCSKRVGFVFCVFRMNLGPVSALVYPPDWFDICRVIFPAGTGRVSAGGGG